MFAEKSKKRTVWEIVGIIVIFVLLLAIVGTFVLYGVFKDSNTAPNMFGYRVYIMNGDGMEPRIQQGAAVFVKEGATPNEGNVILCNINGKLAVVGYVGSEEVVGSDGATETRYIVKYDQGKADEVWGVGKDDIIGVAKTYSTFFGGLVNFASSKTGMLLIVIIPCALLIAYEVVMIVLSTLKKKDNELSDTVKKNEEEDDDSDAEYERLRAQLLKEKREKEKLAEAKEKEESLGGTKAFKLEFTSDKKQEPENDYLASEPLVFKTGSDEPKVAVKPVVIEEPEEEEIKVYYNEGTEVEPKKKSDIDLSNLGASDIDELIKMLEAEKKRLSDN